MIKSGDVVLPARHADGTEQTLRLRCVTTPDEPQKVQVRCTLAATCSREPVLSRLGLTLPRRLCRIDEIPKMQSRLLPQIGPDATVKANMSP